MGGEKERGDRGNGGREGKSGEGGEGDDDRLPNSHTNQGGTKGMSLLGPENETGMMQPHWQETRKRKGLGRTLLVKIGLASCIAKG